MSKRFDMLPADRLALFGLTLALLLLPVLLYSWRVFNHDGHPVATSWALAQLYLGSAPAVTSYQSGQNVTLLVRDSERYLTEQGWRRLPESRMGAMHYFETPTGYGCAIITVVQKHLQLEAWYMQQQHDCRPS